MFMYINASLCYIPEMNTTSKINSTPVQQKCFKNWAEIPKE